MLYSKYLMKDCGTGGCQGSPTSTWNTYILKSAQRKYTFLGHGYCEPWEYMDQNVQTMMTIDRCYQYMLDNGKNKFAYTQSGDSNDGAGSNRGKCIVDLPAASATECKPAGGTDQNNAQHWRIYEQRKGYDIPTTVNEAFKYCGDNVGDKFTTFQECAAMVTQQNYSYFSYSSRYYGKDNHYTCKYGGNCNDNDGPTFDTSHNWFLYEIVSTASPTSAPTSSSSGRRLLEEETLPEIIGEVAIGGLLTSSNANIESMTASSDERVKENIVDVNTAESLSKIEGLALSQYDYTDNFIRAAHKQQGGNVGFIAQQVEGVMPAAVQTAALKQLAVVGDDGQVEVLETFDEFKMVNKNVIFTETVGAVQELSKLVKELQAEVDALKS